MASGLLFQRADSATALRMGHMPSTTCSAGCGCPSSPSPANSMNLTADAMRCSSAASASACCSGVPAPGAPASWFSSTCADCTSGVTNFTAAGRASPGGSIDTMRASPSTTAWRSCSSRTEVALPALMMLSVASISPLREEGSSSAALQRAQRLRSEVAACLMWPPALGMDSARSSRRSAPDIGASRQAPNHAAYAPTMRAAASTTSTLDQNTLPPSTSAVSRPKADSRKLVVSAFSACTAGLTRSALRSDSTRDLTLSATQRMANRQTSARCHVSAAAISPATYARYCVLSRP
mmetsp:Transcript_23705/g.59766  ORF Transcript_23705/g.59766 Transcript_23705/m.59766 type:complete len:294 (+) Transcript_23705:305-1186(+)